MARSTVAKDETAGYVSPYDNPLLWTGHSTVVDEIVDDLKEEGGVGAIVFNANGEVVDYAKLLRNTSRNCSGGKTPWYVRFLCFVCTLLIHFSNNI